LINDNGSGPRAITGKTAMGPVHLHILRFLARLKKDYHQPPASSIRSACQQDEIEGQPGGPL
jgi:hypothetical protein